MYIAAFCYLTINHERQAFMLDGQEIIFHGVNVVKKEHPYVPLTNEFNPLESLATSDIDFLQTHGINLVRLGVMFPGVFPNSGVTNNSYLDTIEAIVNDLGRHGILTLLDLHEDLLGSVFCGEGFPDRLLPPITGNAFGFPLRRAKWLENGTHSVPVKKNSAMRIIRHVLGLHSVPPRWFCSQANFGVYYTTKYVNEAFDLLYSGKTSFGTNLRNEFARYWEKIASRFADNPFVAGYDLLNEPFPGNLYGKGIRNLFSQYRFEKNILQPFYNTAIREIRAVDKNHLVFMAPSSLNFWNTGLHPAADESVIFHMYCYLLAKNGDVAGARLCQPLYKHIFRNIAAQSLKLRIPVFVGEFGASASSKRGITALRNQLELMAGGSWCYWQFKDFSDITTCFPARQDDNEGLFNASGCVFEEKAALIGHPYLQRFAGAIIKQNFAFSNGILTLQLGSGRGVVAFGPQWREVSIACGECACNVSGAVLDVSGKMCDVSIYFERVTG